MADVFISYKLQRRSAAEHLAKILSLYGYTCWYDYELLAGRDFGRQIGQQLRSAKAVVVLWCTMSATSEWVLEEAHIANKSRKLIPVWLEETDLPIGFTRLDTINLAAWDGGPRSSSLDRLLGEVARLVGRPPKPRFADLQAYELIWRTFGAPTLAQFALAARLDEKGLRHISSSKWRFSVASRFASVRFVVPAAVVVALAISGVWIYGSLFFDGDPVVIPGSEAPENGSENRNDGAAPSKGAAETPPKVEGIEPEVSELRPARPKTLEPGAAEPETRAPLLSKDDPAADTNESAAADADSVEPEPAIPTQAPDVGVLKPILRFEGTVPSQLAVIAPSGNRLLAFSRESGASVVDVASSRVLSQVRVAKGNRLLPSSFSADGGAFLAKVNSPGSSPRVSAWALFDASNGSVVASIGSQWTCRAPVFSSDSKHVHGATYYDANSSVPPMSSCETQIWSAQDGTLLSDRAEIQMFGGFIGATQSYLSFQRQGKQLYRKRLDPFMDPVEDVLDFEVMVRDVSIASNGRYAAVSLEGDMVSVIALPKLKVLHSTYSSSRRSGGPRTPNFSEDGNRLLVRPAVADRDFELLEAGNGKSVFRYPSSFYVSNSVYLDVKRGLGYRNALRFVGSGAVLDFLPGFPARMWAGKAIEMASDDAMLLVKHKVVVSDSQEVYFVDIPRQSVQQLEIPGTLGCAEFVFSSGFSRTAAVCDDGSVRVWETRKL